VICIDGFRQFSDLIRSGSLLAVQAQARVDDSPAFLVAISGEFQLEASMANLVDETDKLHCFPLFHVRISTFCQNLPEGHTE